MSRFPSSLGNALRAFPASWSRRRWETISVPFTVTQLRRKSDKSGGGSDTPASNSLTEWLMDVAAVNPNWRQLFEEVAEFASTPVEQMEHNEGDEIPQFPTKDSTPLPLSGLKFAASDDLALKGFAIRFGVRPSMFHQVAVSDHEFLSWIRNMGGATFVGKLKCESSFALSDCCALENNRAAQAVNAGACDVAVVSSLIGPSAICAAVSEEVIAFKPSTSTLPHSPPPFSDRRRSIGVVMGDFASLSQFWDAMAGQTVAGDEAADLTRRKVADPHIYAQSLDDGGVTIGVPVNWINELSGCSEDADGGAGEALRRLLEIRHEHHQTVRKNAGISDGAKGPHIRIKRVPLAWPSDQPIDLALRTVQYELYRKLQQQNLEGSGVLQQLPDETKAHIHQGQRITEEMNQLAWQEIDRMRVEFSEEMQSVDCLCVPISTYPHDSGNLRSIASLVPFSLINCPCLGFRLPLAKTQCLHPGAIQTAKERHSKRKSGSVSSLAQMIRKISYGNNEEVQKQEVRRRHKEWQDHFVDVSLRSSDEKSTTQTPDGKLRSVDGTLPVALIGEPGQDGMLLDVARALM